jgi:hypothetical protein
MLPDYRLEMRAGTMKQRIIRVNALAVCLVGGVLAISLSCSISVCGQGSAGAPAGAGPPSNPNPRFEDRVRQLAEGRLRSAEMDAATESEYEKHIQAAIVTMKEDFTRIQVLRNDIARNLVAHKPLNYDLISQQTGEINKRTSELNTYMVAHPPGDKEQNDLLDVASEEMISALVKLCKLVDSFTDNPSLKNALTVDAKGIEKAKIDKARADKDLLAIIKLSDRIHKKSDSLKAAK